LAQLEAIQASIEALQAHLEQALAKIEQNVQKNKEIAESISRSPRAIKTIQALEATIAVFGQNKPNPKYQVSEYATRNKHWKRTPSVHPVPITDLLEYDVQNQHNKNWILGDKVAQVLQQNMHLADEISEAYQTPSEKLKKDPIMALVTKTVATYMFLKHNNGAKRDPGMEDFSFWGEHNKNESREVMIDSRTTATKSESENKSQDIMTDSKTKGTKRKEQNVTAKADKAKAIKRTKNEIRIELESQQDKFRKYLALKEPILQFSFHLHLAAAFTISILFFNYVLSDHFDHHFMYPF